MISGSEYRYIAFKGFMVTVRRVEEILKCGILKGRSVNLLVLVSVYVDVVRCYDLICSVRTLCYAGSVVCCIYECRRILGIRCRSAAVEYLACHQSYSIVVSCSSRNRADSFSVVVGCTDDSCHMGSMAASLGPVQCIACGRLAFAGFAFYEIETISVIYIAVSIIILSCLALNLGRIDPKSVLKVLVHAVDSAIKDSHHYAWVTSGKSPGILYADICSCYGVLGYRLVSCVDEVPLMHVVFIIKRIRRVCRLVCCFCDQT